MGQPILEVEHLKKSYVNNVPILDDVSFSLQKGEVVVIVGPSGCGKSTTLRMIAGLESISEGELLIDGERMNEVESCNRKYCNGISKLCIVSSHDRIRKYCLQYEVKESSEKRDQRTGTRGSTDFED